MAASITPGNTKTTLNGAADVTVVAAPAAGLTRTVLAIRTPNLDTVAATMILKKDVSATVTEVDRLAGAAPNFCWKPVNRDMPIILTETDSLKMALGGAITTTNPICYVEWLDRTP